MDSRYHDLNARLRTIPTALAVALAACVSPAGSGTRTTSRPVTPPASFSYAPFAAHYRGVARGHVEQEVSGRWTVNDFHLRYELSVRLDSTEGLLATTLIVDSVPEVAGAGFDPAQAARLQGATFTATLASDGELLQFRATEPMSAEPIQDLVTRVLQDFFPRLPVGGAQPGAEWDDTLETTTTFGGIDITRMARRHHVVSSWALDGELRTLSIETRSDYDLKGSGEQSGREFTLVGRGRRLIRQLLAEDGRYLGHTAADTSEATVELDVNLVIPIRQTRIDSLSIAT